MMIYPENEAEMNEPLRILIVDDEPNLRLTLEDILKNLSVLEH